MEKESERLILVVDDEPDMRTFVSTVLETSGYRVATAADGEIAIAAAIADPPDMVILDVMMPGIEEGLAAYQKLRTEKSLSEVPVVMLSAIAKKTFFHMIKNLAPDTEIYIPEPDAYLEKPPEAEDILAVVEKILAR